MNVNILTQYHNSINVLKITFAGQKNIIDSRAKSNTTIPRFKYYFSVVWNIISCSPRDLLKIYLSNWMSIFWHNIILVTIAKNLLFQKSLNLHFLLQICHFHFLTEYYKSTFNFDIFHIAFHLHILNGLGMSLFHVSAGTA